MTGAYAAYATVHNNSTLAGAQRKDVGTLNIPHWVWIVLAVVAVGLILDKAMK